jgi:hypothetical protein
MKFRGLLAVMVVTLFACLTAVASASAAECTASTGGGCIEVGKELTAELLLLGHKKAGTTSVLAVSGLAEIECSEAEPLEEVGGVFVPGVTLLETTGSGIVVDPFVVDFKGSCHVIGHAACKVTPEEIKTKPITGSATTVESGSGDANFAPVTPEEFATVNVSGCEQEAIIVVKGTQLCLMPAFETEVTSHELVCTASGSKLKDGTKAATFTLTEALETEAPAKAFKFRLNFF